LSFASAKYEIRRHFFRSGGARAQYCYCAARLPAEASAQAGSAALCHFLQIFAKIRSSVVVKPHTLVRPTEQSQGDNNSVESSKEKPLTNQRFFFA